MKKQYTNPFIPDPYIANLAKAMRDYEIWFHMLEEGEQVEDGLTALYTMTRTLNAAKPLRLLSDAIEIMSETHQRGTWRKADLVPMITALQIVGSEYPALPRAVALRSIKEVFGVAA